MATGGGKSLCFQIPPLVLNKPAIVISPLISLMQDQVMALNARGIKACFLGTAQTDQRITEDAWAGKYKFIYITPELAMHRLASLSKLQAVRGLSLVAIDEAHCVSEWGVFFRREYRQLGELRDHLTDVPFIALTATATPRVRDDIVTNLRLDRNKLDRWLESFERPNLMFEVAPKGPTYAFSFRSLVEEMVAEAARPGGKIDPTIIYTISRKESEEIAHHLQYQRGIDAGKIGIYHAERPASERQATHAGFLRDTISVVCCTIAFGMGVDKSNVRRVVHYGMPSSLEAYYQHAGRAGRDGLYAKCLLLFGHSDSTSHCSIRNQDEVENPTFLAGLESMRQYCYTRECRHRQMVNHFEPDSFQVNPATGRCTGGCDNCSKLDDSDDLLIDLTKEARLMLATLKYLDGFFGLKKALLILRGSNSKEVKEHWKHWKLSGGSSRVYGAGSSRSEAWWSGLVHILHTYDLVSSETRAGTGSSGRSYSVVIPTHRGIQFLNLPNSETFMAAPTRAMLEEQQYEALRGEAVAAAAAAAAATAQQGTAEDEVQKLFHKLSELRQLFAASSDIAPTMVISDSALWEVARKRPSDLTLLAACEGCGNLFIQKFGAAFIAVVVEFCGHSINLHANSGWKAARPVDSARLAPGSALPAHLSKLLNEAKTAATEAYSRFAQGETMGHLASAGREKKPINLMTVAGYLADAAAAGVSMDWKRLTAECVLHENLGKQIGNAVLTHGADGFRAVRDALPFKPEYGHIKVVAAMMFREEHWFNRNEMEGGEVAGDGSQVEQTEKVLVKKEKHENVDGNADDCVGASAEEELPTAIKRQRVNYNIEVDAINIKPSSPSLEGETTPPFRVDADTVLTWLERHGPATGPALLDSFAGGENNEQRRRQELRKRISAVLTQLMDSYDVCRKGGMAATSDVIDLDKDSLTMYMAI